jgi:hypothetical protein
VDDLAESAAAGGADTPSAALRRIRACGCGQRGGRIGGRHLTALPR